MRALIGHTGFVGSNLLRCRTFDATFNSRNSQEVEGQSFDEVVCAGVSAAKWIANREPDADRAALQDLMRTFEAANIRRFVLISTIDVYPDPSEPLDEDATLHGLANHAYGTNRYELETWVRHRFADYLIVRLPALFGPGLKKNALYDLLNSNAIDRINPAGVFQWYPVTKLATDLDVASTAGLRLVNLFTAAIAMTTVIERFFPGAPVGAARTPAPHYALRTRHAELFGGRNGVIMDESQVLGAMATFIEAERATTP